MFRFLRRHIFTPAATAMAGAIALSGVVNDLWGFVDVGLPKGSWTAIGAALFIVSVIGVLYQARKDIDKLRDELTQRKEADPELVRLRGNITALAEALTSYAAFEQQQKDVEQLYDSIKRSRNVVWARHPAKQLRRDFLNSCGWAMSNKKHFASVEEDQETRKEISSRASELEDCLVQQ